MMSWRDCVDTNDVMDHTSSLRPLVLSLSRGTSRDEVGTLRAAIEGMVRDNAPQTQLAGERRSTNRGLDGSVARGHPSRT